MSFLYSIFDLVWCLLQKNLYCVTLTSGPQNILVFSFTFLPSVYEVWSLHAESIVSYSVNGLKDGQMCKVITIGFPYLRWRWWLQLYSLTIAIYIDVIIIDWVVLGILPRFLCPWPDGSFSQGHDTPVGHGHQLCEILSRSDKWVRRYDSDTMWTEGQTETDWQGDFLYIANFCLRGGGGSDSISFVSPTAFSNYW